MIFGKSWLGNLVTYLGGNSEEINCRGQWFDLQIQEDNTLTFETETAWAEMDEFRHFIESKFEDLKMYYCSEESGNCYYVTNDAEGKYYHYRFVVEVDDDEIQKFQTEEEAKSYIEELIGRKLYINEDPEYALSEWSEVIGKEYTSYHIYKIVED